MRAVLTILALSAVVVLTISKVGINEVRNDQQFLKLSSPKFNSLILGTSRAEKLDEKILSKVLNENDVINYPVLNYAFNNGLSPYGPSYSKSSLSKADTSNNQQGIFIFCIDPWSISAKKGGLNTPSEFREAGSAIEFNSNVSYPALSYFFTHFNNSFYSLLLPRRVETLELNKPSAQFAEKATTAKIKSYTRRIFHNESISTTRLESLKSDIEKLSKYGSVYLVRLPVTDEMKELESSYYPNFEKLMQEIVLKNQARIIDFYPISTEYYCPDGDHLWEGDAQRISAQIAQIISLDSKGMLERGNENNLLLPYLKYQRTEIEGN